MRYGILNFYSQTHGALLLSISFITAWIIPTSIYDALQSISLR